MFQGSASLEKMDHVNYVQSSGGTLNGSTRLDYTNYFEALPSNALERALFLEADRMRAPARHRGEPRQPDRGGEGGDPGQRPQPALRRLPVADPAAGAVRDVPQRPQRLWRVRGPGERHRRGRPRLLRPLLRARQRGARSRRRPRPRRGHGADRAALRRRPAADRPRPARLRRAGARPPSGATSTSTRWRRRRRSPLGWRVPDPPRPRRLPAVRRATPCSPPATRHGCAAGSCRTTGSPATSARTWPSWRTRSTCATRRRCSSRRTTPAT